MRPGPALATFFVLAGATGCHSAFVDAVVSNHTAQPVTLIELDYPSASFGTQTLAPGADFHYRFKVQGTGNLKLLWTDSAHKDHAVVGPQLTEGAEGGYAVNIQPDGVDWQPSLKGSNQAPSP